MPELDATDRRLLALLQRDARASTQALADAAGLSASPAWRRVRRLEAEGFVAAHVTLLDRARLGLHALAYVRISLTAHTPDVLARFDRFVQSDPRILECATVTGSSDYLMKVVAEGPEALEAFLMHDLLATGIVRATETAFVLRQTKATTALPL